MAGGSESQKLSNLAIVLDPSLLLDYTFPDSSQERSWIGELQKLRQKFFDQFSSHEIPQYQDEPDYKEEFNRFAIKQRKSGEEKVYDEHRGYEKIVEFFTSQGLQDTFQQNFVLFCLRQNHGQFWLTIMQMAALYLQDRVSSFVPIVPEDTELHFISFDHGQLILEVREQFLISEKRSLLGSFSAKIRINVNDFSIAYSDAEIQFAPEVKYTTVSVGSNYVIGQAKEHDFLKEMKADLRGEGILPVDAAGKQYVVQTSEVRQVKACIDLFKNNTVFDDVVLASQRFLSVLPTAWTPDAERPARQLAEQLKKLLASEHRLVIYPLVASLHRLALKQRKADPAVFEKIGGPVLLEQLEQLEQLERVRQWQAGFQGAEQENSQQGNFKDLVSSLMGANSYTEVAERLDYSGASSRMRSPEGEEFFLAQKTRFRQFFNKTTGDQFVVTDLLNQIANTPALLDAPVVNTGFVSTTSQISTALDDGAVSAGSAPYPFRDRLVMRVQSMLDEKQLTQAIEMSEYKKFNAASRAKLAIDTGSKSFVTRALRTSFWGNLFGTSTSSQLTAKELVDMLEKFKNDEGVVKEILGKKGLFGGRDFWKVIRDDKKAMDRLLDLMEKSEDIKTEVNANRGFIGLKGAVDRARLELKLTVQAFVAVLSENKKLKKTAQKELHQLLTRPAAVPMIAKAMPLGSNNSWSVLLYREELLTKDYAHLIPLLPAGADADAISLKVDAIQAAQGEVAGDKAVKPETPLDERSSAVSRPESPVSEVASDASVNAQETIETGDQVVVGRPPEEKGEPKADRLAGDTSEPPATCVR